MSRKYFGTDGIRGVAGQHPMTADFAYSVGVAATEALKANGISVPRFLIGTDTRRSGQMLAQALSSGMMTRGAEVTFLGVLPTPGVSYLTCTLNADAGVVISASHNPYEDNGIKFFNHKGEKLSDEVEHTIEKWLEQPHTLEPVTGDAIGTSSRYRRDNNDYMKFLLSHAPYLDGLRLGLDCANGAAYELAPKIFQQIGARLDVINAHPDGVNINLHCGSTHPEALQARVKSLELDIGITFDGDADRALLVDKKGRLVTGDHILAICAATRNEKTIVATLMSNLGVENYLAQRGVSMMRTQVGDRYVHEALLANHLNLGGEQSGHVLFLDKAPTGDGLLTALQTLAAVRKSGKSLEGWMDEIPLYPQTLVNVKVPADKKKSLQEHPKVVEAVKHAETTLGSKGRINLRPSGTEALIRVMVEGADQHEIEGIAKAVAAVVETAY
ncbi:MAG: phosphoglucosamine mutase [Trueperaceae bacterium]